eukprot:9371539-Alexandrium_andersonii.AAC.1
MDSDDCTPTAGSSTAAHDLLDDHASAHKTTPFAHSCHMETLPDLLPLVRSRSRCSLRRGSDTCPNGPEASQRT